VCLYGFELTALQLSLGKGNGWTALMRAAWQGHAAYVKVLLAWVR
jgi:hypothetical protein